MGIPEQIAQGQFNGLNGGADWGNGHRNGLDHIVNGKNSLNGTAKHASETRTHGQCSHASESSIPGTHNRSTSDGLSTSSTSPPASLLNRASEVSSLLTAVQSLIIPFVASADSSAADRASALPLPETTPVAPVDPTSLTSALALELPVTGSRTAGVLALITRILSNSVNTWDQGYLDKLCASTDAVGLASELVLAALNTNAHVYRVSPALTVVEKATSKRVAELFGLMGPGAGGVTCAGGSASNLTSLVSARAALYPGTKSGGNGDRRFVLFVNEHGHYSVEKAAVAAGMGHDNVVAVPADKDGRMDPSALRDLVVAAKRDGKTPLYVCATAGTTVLGAYDPLREVAAVCKEFGMWFHVDASWGGAAVFSEKHRHKLDGSDLADSLTFNAHKMLHVPSTCSFLVARDMALLHRANTLPAGYLFHSLSGGDGDVWDMADYTIQCGRRADSLKLALSWTYYGSAGFEAKVDGAFQVAGHFAELVDEHPEFMLVSSNPPPCLQVCFYYAPGGKMRDEKWNTRATKEMAKCLLGRGFMIDYAPGPRGNMFRVAFNLQTLMDTARGLMLALTAVAKEVAW